MNLLQLIQHVDYTGIQKTLAQNPALANEAIALDERDTVKAHPLHRLCDGVFHRMYTDEQAVEMAKIFLAYGASVDGYERVENRDTPLVAAASLHADAVAQLYLEHGADIHHGGCHGGTALHWAAWCGRDKLVERLLQEPVEINRRCVDFHSTPLLWAVHGYKFGEGSNRHHQVACVKLLLQAGADATIPNKDGHSPYDFLQPEDHELRMLLASIN
ncbi:MAG TPA: ankyrin repeat domain-containing protein [Ohtaekwangia sp.]|uniref:ankyrin repeat domain-containing protein n=1 Tax=Ohtaekwangia sp. TaxID=2066019 RepID=UPI002F948232